MEINNKTSMNPQEKNNWIIGLHLVQLCNLLVPLSGLMGAMSIWQLKRSEIDEIGEHGKDILNFQISMAGVSLAIYLVLSSYLIGPATMAYDPNGVNLVHSAISFSYFITPFLYGILIGFPLYSVSRIQKGMQPFYPYLYRFFR